MCRRGHTAVAAEPTLDSNATKTQITEEKHVAEGTSQVRQSVTKPRKSAGKALAIKVFAGVGMSQWTGADFKDGKKDGKYGSTTLKNRPAYTFHVGALADYSFASNFYAGGGLVFNQKGYKRDATTTSGEYWDDEGPNYDGKSTYTLTSSNIEVPIHIGAAANLSQEAKVFVETGPYITFALGGTLKQKGWNSVSEDIHSSEKEYIDEKEKIGDGSLTDYKKFGYGILASVGASYNRVFFKFSFQRGLSKMIKDSKKYEQNMLFSLGYEF